MTADLVSEFLAARDAMTPRYRAVLHAAGIPTALVDLWGLFGVSSVEVYGEHYQPAPEGPIAFIAPIRGGLSLEHPDPIGLVLFGDIIDLLCWHPARPDRWALRLGSSNHSGRIPAAAFAAASRPRTCDPPLGWFRSGGTGLCLLTRRHREIQSILLSLQHIVADDPAHRRRLFRICRMPYPTPAISMAGPRHQRFGQHATPAEQTDAALAALDQSTIFSEA